MQLGLKSTAMNAIAGRTQDATTLLTTPPMLRICLLLRWDHHHHHHHHLHMSRTRLLLRWNMQTVGKLNIFEYSKHNRYLVKTCEGCCVKLVRNAGTGLSYLSSSSSPSSSSLSHIPHHNLWGAYPWEWEIENTPSRILGLPLSDSVHLCHLN